MGISENKIKSTTDEQPHPHRSASFVSLCGVYSIRIENVGVRRPPSDDLQIQGIADALDFRKAVLTRLSNVRSEAFSRQASAVDDTSNLRIGYSRTASMSPSRSIRHDSLSHSGDLAVLQKLEEVGNSVKLRDASTEAAKCQSPSKSLLKLLVISFV
ncbi:hypothetical protein RND71_024724 [Anisodus tanguticus]|uniref:DUF7642 domain-containing protein n=1 Tax=Anisodus tanguticus TaxID=243964 RepID=A0AAE1RQ35_9SOLA|nr:hypothetical protein RND71_024724 [Anisodus tanguticus]